MTTAADNGLDEHSKRIKERQQDFAFSVMLLLEEEKEFNRERMKETGYRIGIVI